MLPHDSASRHYSALSVFKERRIVEMWKMQAGILLQCGVSGRCWVRWQGGLSLGRSGPLVSSYPCRHSAVPPCSQSIPCVCTHCPRMNRQPVIGSLSLGSHAGSKMRCSNGKDTRKTVLGTDRDIDSLPQGFQQ